MKNEITLAAAPQVAPAQPSDCARSHPHENMSADCEAKTIVARHNNALAQVAQPSAVTDEREAFEAWAIGQRFIVDRVNGVYEFIPARLSWEAWQASRLSAQRDTASKPLVPEFHVDLFEDAAHSVREELINFGMDVGTIQRGMQKAVATAYKHAALALKEGN